MTKLLIDISVLQDQYFRRGIGRYGLEMTRQVLQNLHHGQLNQTEIHFCGLGTWLMNVDALELKGDLREFALESHRIYYHQLGEPHSSTPKYNLTSYYPKLKNLINQIQPSGYWAFHFERGIPSHAVKSVATVHDAIPLRTGKFSQQGWLFNLAKGIYYKWTWSKLKRAQLILAPSNYAKLELCEYGNLPQDKIAVVPLGISAVFAATGASSQIEQAKERFGIGSKYLIYDAGLEANKNVDRLLAIFAQIREEIADLELVITGGDFEINEAKIATPVNLRAQRCWELAAQLGIQSALRPTGRISEQDIVSLFQGATAYINLSNFEGFGFGPLQAMKAGTLAITSENPVFIEVSGPGAYIINPESVSSAGAKIAALLNDPIAVQDYIAKGSVHAAKFTWENTFKTTWEQISKVLN